MRRQKRVWVDLETYTTIKPDAKASLFRGQIIRIPSKRELLLVEVKKLTKTHTWVKPIDTRQTQATNLLSKQDRA